MKPAKRLAALGLALACLLCACGRPQDGEEGEKRLVDDVKVSDAYFGLACYSSGPLDPVTDNTGINRLVCEALYEGLFEVSESFTAQNVLCADYTGDGTTFTFTLRDDVTFWSGAALTAQDAANSLRAAWQNEDSPFYSRLTEVSSIETVSNSELRITLSSPNINFPRLLDIPIRRTSDGDFADGTGPFRPVRTEDGTWVLQNNEAWHGGFLGSIRRITLLSASRGDAVDASFRTGDVSMLRTPRITVDGGGAKLGGSVDAVRTPGACLHYLGVNHQNGKLSDAGVRQALSAALDRQSLCDIQLQTFAVPAVLPVNPQPSADGLELNLRADTERAIRLLREAAEDGLTEPSTDPGNGGDEGEPEPDEP